MHVVLAADSQLKAAYADPASRKPLRQGNPANFEVHRRAVVLAQKHPSLSYREAMQQVLAEDPELKVNYARS